MARPKREGNLRVFNIGEFRLWEGEDDDIIAFFESIPPRKRVRAIIAALRAGGMSQVQAQNIADDDELDDAAGGFL